MYYAWEIVISNVLEFYVIRVGGLYSNTIKCVIL